MLPALISWFFWWSTLLVEKNRARHRSQCDHDPSSGNGWTVPSGEGWRGWEGWGVWGWVGGGRLSRDVFDERMTIQGSDELRPKQGHLSGNLAHLRGFQHLKPALQAVLKILPQHVVRSSMICWILIGAGLFSWRSTWRGKSQQNFQNAVTVVLNDSIEWNI